MHSKNLILIALSLFLTACIGKGGGGTSQTLSAITIPDVPYIGEVLSSPSTIYTSSIKQQAFSYTYSNVGGGQSINVTSIDESTSNGRLDLSLNSASEFDASRVVSAPTSTDFTLSVAGGDDFSTEDAGSRTVLLISNTENTRSITIATSTSFDYQSFGVWLDSTGSPAAGAAFTTGSPTSALNLPPSGFASYTGYSKGIYLAPDGTPYNTSSNINATAFFAPFILGGEVLSPPYVSVTSSSTSGVNVNTGASTTLNNANFLGSLDIATGTSNFSGSLSGSSGVLSGSASGTFYGPMYEEIGGTFRLTGSGINYIGSFGASQ